MTFAPKHVFVPVAVGPSDDASLAEQLVDAACDVLLKTAGKDARITLAYVVPSNAAYLGVDTGFAPPAYYQGLADMLEANRASAQKQLDALVARAKARDVRASSELLDPLEGVGEALAETARKQSADLIMLSSHGRRGLKRFFLGSVAERVAHLATTPVLIMRAG